MAPHKQPQSLYNLACKSCITLLHNSCVGIHRRHGSYDSEDCVQAIQELQSVLLAIVPGIVWNDLCEQLALLTFVHEQDVSNVTYGIGMLLDVYEFLKFSYAIFAHKRLTSLMLVDNPEHFWGFGYRDDPLFDTVKRLKFWDGIFMNCNKVTKIVFPYEVFPHYPEQDVAWMFRLISKHCTDVEMIHFNSTVDCGREAISFLQKCKKLRRIEDNLSQILCCFSPEKYKQILDSLPELECFPDLDLVSCFPDLEAGRELKLTELTLDDRRLTPTNIELVARICPKLKHLEASNNLYLKGVPKTIDLCSAIFEVLAKSTLNLTYLHLGLNFLSGDSFQHFFSMKGVHLLTLKFDCEAGITFKSLKIISEYCLNLKLLHFEILSIESDPDDHPTASNTLTGRQSPIFKKLTTLHLVNIDELLDHRVIKWFLLHATNLETLTLVDGSHYDLLNWEVSHVIIAFEQLSELVDVKLRLGLLNREMVRCLYNNCPKLRKLNADLSNDTDTQEYVNALRKHIASNNIDLTIGYE